MTDSATPAETPPQPQPTQPGLKFLEAAVYIMGGLLVLMFVVLIGGIAWKIANRGEAPPPEAKLIDLGLPAETKVNQLALDGDRLAIDTGTEIIVVDVRKGAIVSRIKLHGP